MNRLHGSPGFAIPFLQQVHKTVAVERHFQALAHLREDLIKHLLVRAADFHFHLNAAQESAIDQFTGIKVGGEDDQLAEWNFQRLPGVQAQKVDARFQRDDPAIEQLLRADLLAAKVVDEEHAAIGFHLQRRFVDLGHRLKTQFQRVHRQFAAHPDRRALEQAPALVHADEAGLARRHVTFRWRERDVHHRIVNLHDLPADGYGIGQPDRIGTGQQLGDGLGDRGLAVTGRSVQEQRRTGVDRRADAPVKILGQDQAAQRLLDLGWGHFLPFGGLQRNGLR